MNRQTLQGERYMLKAECIVCGARRKFKSLVYDQSLNAYCASAMQCTKGHPNSQANCKERGTFLDMLPYEEALHLQKQRTEYTYEETAHTFGKRVRNVNMHKLITGSISFRVASEAQADYISYTLAKIGSNKITDALHYIMNQAIERDSAFLAQYTQKRGAYTATPVQSYEEPTHEEPQPRERLNTVPSRPKEADEGVFTL